MSITDELREWAKTKCFEWRAYELLAIADRIDEQHRRALAAAYQDGYEAAEEAATWMDER